MKSKLIFSLLAIIFITFAGTAQDEADPAFASFQLTDLQATMQESGRPWLPFFQGENVLAGIYSLKAGSEDGQPAHDTDEVYYVVSGKAKFTADGQTEEVTAGSILFVKAEVDHRFVDIEEDITLVVFFDK